MIAELGIAERTCDIATGAIAFSRIPYLPHSLASERVSASTPALATTEGTTKPEPVQAYVVTMLKTTPPVCASIQRLPQASVQWALYGLDGAGLVGPVAELSIP